MSMPFIFNDGGRAAAGFKGRSGDCVTRSIAIATGLPYREVYDALSVMEKRRKPRNGKRKASARDGVSMENTKRYMKMLGWEWVPTMKIGSGCKVHLVASELPSGRIVVRVSKHITAVIDGVIHDTYDPTRTTFWYDENRKLKGISERCVYGYWREPKVSEVRSPFLESAK